MSRRVATATVFLCACAASLAEVAAQGLPDRIVIVAPQVDIRLDGRVVDRAVRGQVFKVGGIRGPWLWIRHRRSGWIEKPQVMPLNQAAVTYFSALIRSQPAAPANYHARGNVWAHLGQPNRAISDFTAAIRLDANRPASLINRGLAHHRLGKYDEAIADYDAAIRIEVSNPIAYNNRGLTRHAQGEFPKAIDDFNEAIRLDAGYVVAYTNRAAAGVETGQYGAALDDFAKALELDPRNPADYCNRAWLLATCPEEGRRDGKQAVADATRACELSGSSARHLEVLAAAYAEAGDFKQAAKTLRAAMKIAPADSAGAHQAMLESFLARKAWRVCPAGEPIEE